MNAPAPDALSGHAPYRRLLALLVLALGGAVVALALVAATAQRAYDRLEAASARRQTVYELLVTLRLLRQHIGESRVGLTGYALTRDTLYRTTYTRGISAFASDTARLRALSRGLIELSPLVDAVGPAIAAYADDLASVMRAVDRQPQRNAGAELQRVRSTLLLEGTRTSVAALEDALGQRLDQSAGDVSASLRRGTTVVEAALLLGMLVIAVSGGALFLQLQARERVEQAFRKRERQLSSIYDTAADVIFQLAVEEPGGYRFASVNQAFQRVTGVPLDQVVGKRVEEVIPEPSLTLVRDAYDRAIREKRIVRWEETSEYPTGRLTGEVSVAPVFDDGGKCTHLVGAVHDITERKAGDDRVRALNAELELRVVERTSLLEATPDALVIVDRDGRITLVNGQTEKLFGYRRSDLLGTPVEMLMPVRFRERHLGHKTAFLTSPQARPMGSGLELFGRRSDASEFPIEISLSPLQTAGGMIVYAAIRDVTDRKRAEDAVRASEARYHNVLDNMLEGAQILGFDWRYLYLNDAAARFGRQIKEEMLGHTVMERYPGFETTEMFAVLRQCMEARTARMAEFEFTYPDGTQAWFEFSIQPVPEGLFILSLDITQRRQAAEGQRLLLASIVESSDDAIISMTLDGVITSWNRGAAKIYGYGTGDIVGQPVSVLIPAERRDEEKRLLDHLKRNERIDHFETVRRRKDGRDVDVSVTISPIQDDTGAIIGASKIARDITALRSTQAALLRAKEAAEAANRELESFSYSVAHDLRAPLRSIDGFSQALLEDHHDRLNADGRKYLTFVRSSAQQMAQLIDALLTLSQVTRGDLHHQTVDLSAVARAVVARLHDIEPDRLVDVVIRDGLVDTADPRLLTVALDNLLGNAWKFTGRRGEARIEFGATVRDEQPAYFVRDNGAGFDMAFAHKLFGAFQRLHAADEFEGTGVGLATVQRIIGRHRGRVWAEGRVDGGATFYFTLNEGTHGRSASDEAGAERQGAAE